MSGMRVASGGDAGGVAAPARRRRELAATHAAGDPLRHPIQASGLDTWLSLAIITGFLLRSSVLAVWVDPMLGGMADLVAFAAIGLAGMITVLRGPFSPRTPGLILLAAMIPSVLFSVLSGESAKRWMGWAALVVVVGPVMDGPAFAALRATLWRHLRILAVLVPLASFAWFVGGFPDYGRGVFSGVMMHSMLLGPISALGATLALGRAIERRSPVWAAIFAVAFYTTLLSGSRVAVTAALMGCLMPILVLGRGGIFAALLPLAVAVAFALQPEAALRGVAAVTPGEVSDWYEDRGMRNTREHLWRTRIAEFQAQPVVGIGFGISSRAAYFSEARMDAGAFGEVQEPGSGYLMILAMTGLAGMAGFLIGSLSAFRAALRRLDRSPRVLALTWGWGAVWGTHMLAEGYVLAVGNILCLMFWAWLGGITNPPAAADARALPEAGEPVPDGRGG